MERDYDEAEHERFANAVRWTADDIAELLISKNKQYGNAALNPIRVFARGVGLRDQLNVRLDDKLSRIQLGNPDIEDEDVERDILGYLIIKAVAKLVDEGNEGILDGTIRRLPGGHPQGTPNGAKSLKAIEELIFQELEAGPAVDLGDATAEHRWLAEAIVSKIGLPVETAELPTTERRAEPPKGADAAYEEGR